MRSTASFLTKDMSRMVSNTTIDIDMMRMVLGNIVFRFKGYTRCTILHIPILNDGLLSHTHKPIRTNDNVRLSGSTVRKIQYPIRENCS